MREFGPAVAALVDALPGSLAGTDLEEWRRAHDRHAAAGVPAPLAAFMATCEPLGAAFEIAGMAAARRVPVPLAAAAWFHSGARLGLDWLRAAIERLEVEDAWDAVARAGLRDAALQVQRALATQVLAGKTRATVAARIERWFARHATELPAWQRSLAEMRAAGKADFAMLSVGVDALRKVVC
jgi:glutamate dehydrogenase